MITRHIEEKIRAALKDTPVIFINGARQTGKSTLAQKLVPSNEHYTTLDDATALASAHTDPEGFLKTLSYPAVIDEIQRAPGLFLAIKKEVDANRTPGRFILTGSANVLLLPKISDSLAGRMEIITLWPFSMGELNGRKEKFIDSVFSPSLAFPKVRTIPSRNDLAANVLTGGFPEIQLRETDERRSAWFGSYINAILQRDIRDIAKIDGLTALPNILSLIAARNSSLLNISELSNAVAIPQTTVKRYLSLMETTFLVNLLPAWSTNRGKRLTKSPKMLLNDSGLTAFLLGVNNDFLLSHPSVFGNLLESFVIMELKKQSGWSKRLISIFHYRTLRGEEVDCILEDKNGSVVGVEVKASSTVASSDFNNLRIFAADAGINFLRGIILYGGMRPAVFEDNFIALPISDLWSD